jgi:selenocysteine lyase/cysteine desulfurase
MNSIDNLKDLTPLLYEAGVIQNPLNRSEYNRIIFADDVASGRPCRAVEHYVANNVYPFYSNTHSNASCGIMMKNSIKQARQIIREQLNLRGEHKIIFTGNGCTGAINHLAHKIDFKRHNKITIHITPFEHHSNYLPWVEMQRHHNNIELNFIQCDDEFNLRVDEFIQDLENKYLTNDRSNKGTGHNLNIISIIGCSNVIGRRYDMQCQKLWEYIKTKKATNDVYYLLDLACSAPHIDINLSKSDGGYISGHKYLGGQCTPGILIVNQELLETTAPYTPGGGCVEKADSKCVVYKHDLESKEMGGTPNVVGIIRYGYVLLVKHAIRNELEHNETIITRYANERMSALLDKYSNLKVIGFESRKNTDLPIYPVVIDGLHYNLVTVLFNDLFGIQTRGGISCCGMLGEICEDRMGIHGWCRISFSYLMTRDDVLKIFEALEYIIRLGSSYLDRYSYDRGSNLYSLKK